MAFKKQPQFMDTETDGETVNVQERDPVGEPDGEEATFESDLDLDALGFDDARDEIEKRKMDAPAGDWKKEEEWEFSQEKNVKVYEGDCEPGDTLPQGRIVYSLFGRPTARTDKEGNEFQPFLRFRWSPDKRYSTSKPDQVDHTYKLCIKAREAFFAANGRKSKSQAELARFLAEENYTITTMRGDDGPFVLNIKIPRKQ